MNEIGKWRLIYIIPIWAFHVLVWFCAVLVGPIVYLLFPKSNEQTKNGVGKFKHKFIDKIWGNEVDGLSGDKAYYKNQVIKKVRDYPKYIQPFMTIIVPIRKRFPWFWWSCVRNPANNLARHIGPSGVVTKISRYGNLTLFETYTGKKLRYGFFYFTPQNKIMFKLGYKLWAREFSEGDWFDGHLAFSIQRGLL
ncbi:MAG: hypothetical protein D6732_18470 [Methanobacteriota archaeon]|nr:MAG: hypothetical protein D6732_18470 [Euryarchaeota archaeon]